MPSRPPSCRKAARSICTSNPSPLWITDDVLDNAFHQFFRVSRTAKRFGSNVPGPLEAQRRLAKRRMMGLAAMGGPAAFDVGVLFSNGPPRKDQLGWEAPRSRERSQGPISRIPPLSTPSQSLTSKPLVKLLNLFDNNTPKEKDSITPIKSRVKVIRTLDRAKALGAESRLCGMDQLEYSKLAYKALLANDSTVDTLLDFLKDPSVNLPEAHHISTFMAHCHTHHHSWDQSVPFRETIHGLLGLGMIQGSEIPHIIDNLQNPSWDMLGAIWGGMRACRIAPIHPEFARRLLKRAKTLKGPNRLILKLYQYLTPINQQAHGDQPDIGDYLTFWTTFTHDHATAKTDMPNLEELIGLLQNLGPRWGEFVLSATKTLIQQKPTAENDIEKWRSLVLHWLAILRETKIGRRYLYPEETKWRPDIYNILAEHFTLRDLATHFEKLPDISVSYLITQCWMPHFYPSSWSVRDCRAITNDLRMIPISTRHLGHIARTTDRLADIVIAVERHGLDYEAPMAAIIDFCFAMFGTRGILQLCSTWRAARLRIHPEAFGAILRQLSEESPLLALKLYHRGRLWIGSSPALVVKLIEGGRRAHSIFKILKHRDPTNSVPIHLRSSAKNILHNSRITLVHLIADAFSHYKGTRGLRQSFRYVWMAYRYLRSREAPLHPLMSRALVRAGIVMPLQRREWVNTARVRWILSVVRRVEGEEVANKIDESVYIWRGKIAKYTSARRRWLTRHGKDLRQELGHESTSLHEIVSGERNGEGKTIMDGQVSDGRSRRLRSSALITKKRVAERKARTDSVMTDVIRSDVKESRSSRSSLISYRFTQQSDKQINRSLKRKMVILKRWTRNKDGILIPLHRLGCPK